MVNWYGFFFCHSAKGKELLSLHFLLYYSDSVTYDHLFKGTVL